eukprot:9032359-Lingulodinium_polyedra.AAC.1
MCEGCIRVALASPGSQEATTRRMAFPSLSFPGAAVLQPGQPTYYSGLADLFHQDEGLNLRALYHIQRLAGQDSV